ncbi:hypothetical protein LZK73_21755 [Neorhizobium galegae]|nr:hypothetical protein LZK73_21755 [Neorhizobium galegae]
MTTTTELAENLANDILENFAPDLPGALFEVAEHMGRPVTMTFTAIPGDENVKVNFNMGKKVLTIEGEKVE